MLIFSISDKDKEAFWTDAKYFVCIEERIMIGIINKKAKTISRKSEDLIECNILC